MLNVLLVFLMVVELFVNFNACECVCVCLVFVGVHVCESYLYGVKFLFLMSFFYFGYKSIFYFNLNSFAKKTHTIFLYYNFLVLNN